ncbi:PA domain-containing protein [Actinomadura fulvescens]|uniref:PA domain-containing protein n=1 Tax=Actinomadura fulvescens TaxID=46160 RepID=A0ABP6CIW5_9ACTN
MMAAYDRRRFLARVMGTTAGAALAGGLGASDASAAAAGGRAPELVDARTLFGWVEEMSELGPRFAGSRAHRRYLSLVVRRLQSYGLNVRRHPVPLDQWEARTWSLKATGADGRTHTIPVAYYRPYSGETPARGVRGDLVDVRAGQAADYQGKDVRGRIVVADYPMTRTGGSAIAPLVEHVHRPEQAAQFATEDYTRVWRAVPEQLSLDLAKRNGAIAMVDVMDLAPEHARGQFSPHQQPQTGLPALHLDRVQGRRLRELMKAGPVTATLTLTAAKKNSTIDYLTAELRGSGTLPGAVLVGTHTDGQNAIEENGVPAIVALAKYFARVPLSERPRDLVFVFSPNHMNSHRDTPDLAAWLTRNAGIRERIVAALVPEHLGALGWSEDPATGAFRPTGRSEPAVVGTGNSAALTALAIDQVRRDDLERTVVLKPFDNGLYGEATYPYRLGIPTATLISGPAYLVQVAPDGHLDKIDPDLMHRQTVFLSHLLSRMLALPDY